MAKLLANSYVRPVYYPAGTSNGQQLYKRAPFDVLVLNGKSVIQPRSFGGKIGAALAQQGVDSDLDKSTWRDGDFGFETLQPIVLGEHEMGDGSDNWKGLHRFGSV